MLRFTIGLFVCLYFISPVWAGQKKAQPPSVDFSNDDSVSLSRYARFLTQATFGGSIEEVYRLQDIGYERWIEEQAGMRITLQRPAIQGLVSFEQDDLTSQRVSIWWKHALKASDQLRQRVAFALSEILVVSDLNDLTYWQPLGIAEYYDNLARGAFGNFRTLLEDVSKSSVMGLYLSHLQNQRADPERNIRPDENFAREILQLFTIGLWHLNVDGTRFLDQQGQPVPTYNQNVVEEFARVFTGWNFADAEEWDYYPWEEFVYLPMEPYNNPLSWEREGGYHDRQEKLLLAYPVEGIIPEQWPRAVLPELQVGEDAQTDLTRALDVIFYHPNVGPFIGRRLIQRLVTSNPSPQYIRRVAEVFNDNGFGIRGDMLAVVKAILLDKEARSGQFYMSETFGKLREPLLRMTQFWRAFNAEPLGGGLIPNYYFHYWFAQAPMRSPSVFNFFTPDYHPPGEITDANLVAPEFQITNETFVNRTANVMLYLLFAGYPGSPDAGEGTMVLNFDRELALAAQPDALVSHLNLLFMSGQMSQEMQEELSAVLGGIPMDSFLEGSQEEGLLRVFLGVYLVVTSPEYVVQR